MKYASLRGLVMAVAAFITTYIKDGRLPQQSLVYSVVGQDHNLEILDIANKTNIEAITLKA